MNQKKDNDLNKMHERQRYFILLKGQDNRTRKAPNDTASRKK